MLQPDLFVSATFFLIIVLGLLEMQALTRGRGGRKGPRPTG
jgi:hypothetical protein